MDDSVLKARLQPHNLLLIPEYSRDGIPEDPDDESEELDPPAEDSVAISPDADKEEILLATIGILEEMRCQTSIPAWIRAGGFWGDKTPPSPEANVETLPLEKEGMESSSIVTLPWFEDTDVIQYWVKKARVCLIELDIPIEAGVLDSRKDAQLSTLRDVHMISSSQSS